MSAVDKAVTVAVAVTVGVVAAHIVHKTEKDRLEKDLEAREAASLAVHQEELNETRYASYNDGWRAALDNALHVRTAYAKHFETADEEAGTTLKGSRK